MQDAEQPLKIDIGCGKNKKPGFVGVDAIAFDGVDVVMNLTDRWPWGDNTVSEIHASHVIEHFGQMHRCWIFNEMYRVLVPGGKVTLIAPHWANNRAFGDPTHQWPPFAEMAMYYLGKKWRDEQAPHTNSMLQCDFEATWGYTVAPDISARNQEFQQFALNHYANAVLDIHATLTKR